MPAPIVIELWPHESECVLCGAPLLLGACKGLPMYQGRVVPDDWAGPWAGFDVCDSCFARYRPEAA